MYVRRTARAWVRSPDHPNFSSANPKVLVLMCRLSEEWLDSGEAEDFNEDGLVDEADYELPRVCVWRS